MSLLIWLLLILCGVTEATTVQQGEVIADNGGPTAPPSERSRPSP